MNALNWEAMVLRQVGRESPGNFLKFESREPQPSEAAIQLKRGSF
jgi:hypothetical protein